MKALFTLGLILTAYFAFGQTYTLVADKLIDPQNGKVLDDPTVSVYKNHIIEVNYKNQ
jgi:hypothetical protein